VKCGSRGPASLLRRTKRYVFVPWYGRLFGLLGQLITQKKAVVELPLCAACDARYRSAVVGIWLACSFPALAVALLFVGVGLNVGALVGGGFFLFLGGLLVPLIAAAVLRRRLLPTAVKIDDHEVTLARVHPSALEFFASSTSAAWQGPVA
jgi:hypothetical protein